jgi:hypothetical protein
MLRRFSSMEALELRRAEVELSRRPRQ